VLNTGYGLATSKALTTSSGPGTAATTGLPLTSSSGTTHAASVGRSTATGTEASSGAEAAAAAPAPAAVLVRPTSAAGDTAAALALAQAAGGGGHLASTGPGVGPGPVAAQAAPTSHGQVRGERQATRGEAFVRLEEELLESFALRLPELEMPAEDELLSAADLAGALLLGARARADILPQGGSQLAPVAVLLADGADDAGAPARAADGHAPPYALLIDPLAAGRPRPQVAATPGAGGAEAKGAEVLALAAGGWRRLLLAVSALLGLAAQGAHVRARGTAGRAKACRGGAGLGDPSA
jgi:hypothetical protein